MNTAGRHVCAHQPRGARLIASQQRSTTCASKNISEPHGRSDGVWFVRCSPSARQGFVHKARGTTKPSASLSHQMHLAPCGRVRSVPLRAAAGAADAGGYEERGQGGADGEDQPSTSGSIDADAGIDDASRQLWPPELPKVPWGVGKIVQVMTLWLLAYIAIGQVAVPMILTLLGLDRDELSIRGHALLHLCLDVSQLGFTLLILWRCLREFKPKLLGLFPLKWRGWWPLLVAACCCVFPAVDWIAQQSVTWFPTDTDGWTNQMEHSLYIGDWITNVAYFCVVSICAPMWEEAIFRGFLLTSLARYMPVGAAVLSSSLLFAMCHFRLQTFLPLLILGIVFSSVFLLTRNLLPPIMLHSAWNVFVLFNLIFRPG